MKFWGISFAVCLVLITSRDVRAYDPALIAQSINKNGYKTLRQFSKQWKVKSDVFAEDHGPYNATVVENWQLPSGPQCCVLRINDQYQWDYQYWVFLQDNKAWKFIGARDSTCQKYSPPEQHIVRIGKQYTYLAIREMTVTGTGVQTIEECWYDVRANELREVFRIPVTGYLLGWNMPFDREYSTRIVSMSDDPTPTVDVAVSAEYTNGIDSLQGLKTLFTIHRTAKYKWSSSTGRFVIDGAASQITEEGVRGLSGDGNLEFLKHNYDELKHLALSPKPVFRHWVKAFLKECSTCQEKTSLLKLLTKS